MIFVFSRHFLVLLPQLDDSEETFCAYYIIFSKCKKIINEEEYKSLENIMTYRFRKLEGSFQKILKKVFAPRLDSVSIISLIVNRLNFAIKTYFGYIKNKQIQECEPEFNFVIDSDEDDQNIVSKDVYNF